MAEQWFYRLLGEEFGPVSTELLQQLLQDGTLGPTDEVRREGSSAWQPARQALLVAPAGLPPAAPEPEPEWYCQIAGIEMGPLLLEDLVRMAENGELTAEDEVRYGALGKWRKALTVGRLASVMDLSKVRQLRPGMAVTPPHPMAVTPAPTSPSATRRADLPHVSTPTVVAATARPTPASGMSVSASPPTTPVVGRTVSPPASTPAVAQAASSPPRSELSSTSAEPRAVRPEATQVCSPPQPEVSPREEPASTTDHRHPASRVAAPERSPATSATAASSAPKPSPAWTPPPTRPPFTPPKKSSAGSSFDWSALWQPLLQPKVLGSVAVMLLAVVAVFGSSLLPKSTAGDRKKLETLRKLHAEFRSLRDKQASPAEWTAFTQKADKEVAAIVAELNRTASRREPWKQQLLWAAKYRWKEMMSNGREKPIAAEKDFERNLYEAARQLGEEQTAPAPKNDGPVPEDPDEED